MIPHELTRRIARAGPHRRTCWWPATTTARWRRSSTTPRGATRWPSRSPRCGRSRAARHHVGGDLRPRAARPRGAQPAADEVHLVGSHGSEFDAGLRRIDLEPSSARCCSSWSARRTAIAGGVPGATLEHKPASRRGPRAARQPDGGPGRSPRSTAGPGRSARRPRAPRQGGRRAPRCVAHRQGRRARAAAPPARRQRRCCSSGDDLTDEDAFATLTRPRRRREGRRGPTRAPATASTARRGGPAAGASWSSSATRGCSARGATPIERHSLLSDQRTAALRHRRAATSRGSATPGSTRRRCSPSCWAARAPGPSRSAPSGDAKPLGTAYVDDTLVVETRWPGFTVTDYLDCAAGRTVRGRRAHRPGPRDPWPGEVQVVFAPRLDFGRVGTRLEAGRRRHVALIGTSDADRACARPGSTWTIDRRRPAPDRADARSPRRRTRRARAAHAAPPTTSCRPDVRARAPRRPPTDALADVGRGPATCPRSRPTLVRRSRADRSRRSCHGPTGRHRGGRHHQPARAPRRGPQLGLPLLLDPRRRRWPRPRSPASAATARRVALPRLADAAPGRRSPSPERLRPVYTVDGRELAPRPSSTELSGYAGSRPVRIGNAAERQVQLDVFGPVVDLVALLDRSGARPSPSDHWPDGRAWSKPCEAPLARARPRHLGGARRGPATTCTRR